jgi:hypothetical protein
VPGGRLLRLAWDGWSAAAGQDADEGGAGGFRCCWDADGEDEEVEEEANIWWWLLTSAISVRKLLLLRALVLAINRSIK